jgi:hypothetical protein
MSQNNPTITPEIVETFRLSLPEFADLDVWSAGSVDRALNWSAVETGSSRWGGYDDYSSKQQGMFLYTAHKLVKQRETALAVEMSTTPYPSGPPTKLIVGDESIEFGLNRPIDYSKDYDLASTVYGTEFIRVRERIGMGACVAGEQQGSYYGMYPGYGWAMWPYYVS